MVSLGIYDFVTVNKSGELQTKVLNRMDKLHIGTITTETVMANGIPLTCGIRVLREYLTDDDLNALNMGIQMHKIGVSEWQEVN